MENHLSRSDTPQAIADESEGTDRGPTGVTGTLRTGVKALFHDGSNVLLTEERRADGSTFWTLPGGGVEPEEPLSTGLHRELREELSCSASISDEVARCRYRHTSEPGLVTHYTVFSATLLTRPDPQLEEGILHYEWVDPDDLPAGTLRPFHRVVQDYEGCESRTTPTHFSGPFD